MVLDTVSKPIAFGFREQAGHSNMEIWGPLNIFGTVKVFSYLVRILNTTSNSHRIANYP